MPSTMVEFHANGGSVHGYLSMPKQGRGPGVVVVQEWWGLVDHIKEVGDRLAGEGFVALAPDLYKGTSTKSPDEAAKLRMALNIPETGKTFRGAAEFLMASDAVQPKRVGVVGFCMGGQLALFAACEHPDVVHASVDFYGRDPRVQLRLNRLKAPVLAHFATRDKNLPVSDARALVKTMEEAGTRVEAHFYEADHAFFNDHRPEVYSPEASSLAWERTIAFLRRELVAGRE